MLCPIIEALEYYVREREIENVVRSWRRSDLFAIRALISRIRQALRPQNGLEADPWGALENDALDIVMDLLSILRWGRRVFNDFCSQVPVEAWNWEIRG